MEQVKSAWSNATQRLGVKRKRAKADCEGKDAHDVSPTTKKARSEKLNGARHDAQDMQDTGEGTPTKRKRGRPRKSGGDPQPTPDSTEHTGMVNGTGTATPTKRTTAQRSNSTKTVESPADAAGDQNSGMTNGVEATTPTRRKRGRPPGSKNKPKAGTEDFADGEDAPVGDVPDPRIKAKHLFATPQKAHQDHTEQDTPALVRNSDRSARRQSARALIERSIAEDLSDEGDQEEEDTLAQRIWGEDGAPNEELMQESVDEREKTPVPTTPSKRGPGRPKGSRRKRSPTPPQDLLNHEKYFFQNRPGGTKTSSNTLSSLSLLTHEEYFSLVRNYIDSHESEQAYLEELHAHSFDQWAFELSEGFNICLHGYGSKRQLVGNFAHYLHAQSEPSHKIVVVNGHLSTFTIRDIPHTVARAALPPAEVQNLTGSQPAELLTSLLALLSNTVAPQVTLLIHSIDSPSLRRPNTQALLSRLAAHPSIHLLATASHPSFPLLWDSSLRTAYNFLFHDCTTFKPPDPSELDVVNSVHELLGRSGRRVGGKEGVAFVLKSLPENARALYRVLVAEQLAGMLEQEEGGGEEEEEMAETGHRGAGNESGPSAAAAAGVEFRVLYQKATEEFICGSEMAFRTLLKEFHDHQMISSRRDMFGGAGAGEILWAPFPKEELEGILEELVD